jgi:hypothetical protein
MRDFSKLLPASLFSETSYAIFFPIINLFSRSNAIDILTGINTNFTPLVFCGMPLVSIDCIEAGVGGWGFSGELEADDDGENHITVAGL